MKKRNTKRRQISGVKKIGSHLQSVQCHYEKIAGSYGRKLNIYCQERFIRILEKFRTGKILEVGCGTGYALSRLKKDAVGIDITLGLLKKGRSRVLCGDGKKLPFKPNTFDIVYSVNLLEHVNYPYELLMECKRVLKKKGIIVVITPNGGMKLALNIAEKLSLKLPEGPHKFLKFKELKSLAKKCGLQVVSAERFILFPKNIRLITAFFEKIEKFFPFFCLFQCVIGKKMQEKSQI